MAWDRTIETNFGGNPPFVVTCFTGLTVNIESDFKFVLTRGFPSEVHTVLLEARMVARSGDEVEVRFRDFSKVPPVDEMRQYHGPVRMVETHVQEDVFEIAFEYADKD